MFKACITCNLYVFGIEILVCENRFLIGRYHLQGTVVKLEFKDVTNDLVLFSERSCLHGKLEDCNVEHGLLCKFRIGGHFSYHNHSLLICVSLITSCVLLFKQKKSNKNNSENLQCKGNICP